MKISIASEISSQIKINTFLIKIPRDSLFTALLTSFEVTMSPMYVPDLKSR